MTDVALKSRIDQDSSFNWFRPVLLCSDGPAAAIGPALAKRLAAPCEVTAAGPQ